MATLSEIEFVGIRNLSNLIATMTLNNVRDADLSAFLDMCNRAEDREYRRAIVAAGVVDPQEEING
jgi:hypothetical protein